MLTCVVSTVLTVANVFVLVALYTERQLSKVSPERSFILLAQLPDDASLLSPSSICSFKCLMRNNF